MVSGKLCEGGMPFGGLCQFFSLAAASNWKFGADRAEQLHLFLTPCNNPNFAQPRHGTG